jgi:hypothetical protein
MIGIISTVKIAPGKTSQALEWTSKVMECIKKKQPNWQQLHLRPLTGEFDELVFVSIGPSLSEFDEVLKNRHADPEWEPILKEFREAEWNLGFTRRLFNVVE